MQRGQMPTVPPVSNLGGQHDHRVPVLVSRLRLLPGGVTYRGLAADMRWHLGDNGLGGRWLRGCLSGHLGRSHCGRRWSRCIPRGSDVSRKRCGGQLFALILRRGLWDDRFGLPGRPLMHVGLDFDDHRAGAEILPTHARAAGYGALVDGLVAAVQALHGQLKRCAGLCLDVWQIAVAIGLRGLFFAVEFDLGAQALDRVGAQQLQTQQRLGGRQGSSLWHAFCGVIAGIGSVFRQRCRRLISHDRVGFGI